VDYTHRSFGFETRRADQSTLKAVLGRLSFITPRPPVKGWKKGQVMVEVPQQLEFQFELFDSSSALIVLPPCGRGLGPCRAVLTYGPSVIARCIVCGCVAPIESQL
jgi:hypothetical protein